MQLSAYPKYNCNFLNSINSRETVNNSSTADLVVRDKVNLKPTHLTFWLLGCQGRCWLLFFFLWLCLEACEISLPVSTQTNLGHSSESPGIVSIRPPGNSRHLSFHLNTSTNLYTNKKSIKHSNDDNLLDIPFNQINRLSKWFRIFTLKN